MRQLNPTLYGVIYEWFHQLPKDYDAKKNGNSSDNLKNSQEAIIASLIEQFPKSYREAYEVYEDLFSQRDIFSVYHHLEEINVLALATGSGGDVFGFIHACESYLRGKKINIFTVEGNKDALRSQMNLFRQCIEFNLVENEINLIPIETVIEPGFMKLTAELKEICLKKYGIKKFDVIQSFKWMNEQSVRGKLSFYELYHWMNHWLLTDRIAVILEYASPVSKEKYEREVSMRALNDFALFCKHQWRNNKLVALTPTPCIARKLNGNKAIPCRGCTGCYSEIESYVKLSDQKKYAWQSHCVFVMKLATGELGQVIARHLQDERVGYQTATHRGDHPTRFCTLDANVLANEQADAFLLNQK